MIRHVSFNEVLVMIRIIGCINGFEYKLIISTSPAMQELLRMYTQTRGDGLTFFVMLMQFVYKDYEKGEDVIKSSV